MESVKTQATGSGGGCFAAYLVKYNYLSTDSIDFKVEQGMEIGRPSLLYLRANKENDEISVKVGGKVIDIIHGRLCLIIKLSLKMANLLTGFISTAENKNYKILHSPIGFCIGILNCEKDSF